MTWRPVPSGQAALPFGPPGWQVGGWGDLPSGQVSDLRGCSPSPGRGWGRGPGQHQLTNSRSAGSGFRLFQDNSQAWLAEQKPPTMPCGAAGAWPAGGQRSGQRAQPGLLGRRLGDRQVPPRPPGSLGHPGTPSVGASRPGACAAAPAPPGPRLPLDSPEPGTRLPSAVCSAQVGVRP